MSEVEPAWRAELRREIRGIVAEENGFNLEWLEPSDYQSEASKILLLLEPHIQAAEQRGREEGLRQGRCQRCKGSGIDPEHSYPAEGPSYHSMGEPPHLEPCIDCQFPESP